MTRVIAVAYAVIHQGYKVLLLARLSLDELLLWRGVLLLLQPCRVLPHQVLPVVLLHLLGQPAVLQPRGVVVVVVLMMRGVLPAGGVGRVLPGGAGVRRGELHYLDVHGVQLLHAGVDVLPQGDGGVA